MPDDGTERRRARGGPVRSSREPGASSAGRGTRIRGGGRPVPGIARAKFAAALILASLASVACAGGGWIEDHPDVADRAREHPATFVEAAAGEWSGIDGLAGSYRLDVSRGVGRRGFDLEIIVRRPDRVRLEVIDPTAATQLLLVAGPGGVGLYVAEDRVVYTSADLDAFHRALGLELGPEEAIGVLLGYGFAAPDTEPSEVSWSEDRRRIELAYPGGKQWLHPVTLRYEEIAFAGGASGDEDRARAELEHGGSGVDDGEAAAVPERLRIAVPGEGLTLRLARGTWRVNPEVRPGTFEVPRPPGVREAPMEALTREEGLFRRPVEEQGDGEGR